MIKEDHAPEISPKSKSVAIGGFRFEIKIFRLETDTGWSLEAVDQDGMSHVRNGQFASDEDAQATAIAALEEAGAITFMAGDSVVPFQRS